MDYMKFYPTFVVFFLVFLSESLVQGYDECLYNVCYGDSYCCNGGRDCCTDTVYVYQLWWFWFIWIFFLMLIISCIIGIRRRRYQQRRHQIRVGQPVYGTTVVAGAHYQYPPPPSYPYPQTAVTVPTAPAYAPPQQQNYGKPPPYQ